MIVSFYSKDLAIVFDFERAGRVKGILTENNRQAYRMEFTGIFEADGHTSICFMIDWSRSTVRYQDNLTAYSGVIIDDTLELNWLNVVNGESAGDGSAILVRDFQNQDSGTESQGSKPYPVELMCNVMSN
jgi:hypothetical protein